MYQLNEQNTIDHQNNNHNPPNLTVNSQYMICISRIHISVLKKYVLSIFCKLDIGHIININEIAVKDSPEYRRLVIKVNWNNSKNARLFIDKFEQNKTVKIVHNKNIPDFWVCKPFI